MAWPPLAAYPSLASTAFRCVRRISRRLIPFDPASPAPVGGPLDKLPLCNTIRFVYIQVDVGSRLAPCPLNTLDDASLPITSCPGPVVAAGPQ